MKAITKFTARGVFGHLKIDLRLKKKLTFLYGLNGSGKTTALKLMMALLEPSLEPLIRIPFREIKLVGTTHNHDEITVLATKNNNSELSLKCSLVPNETFTLSNLENLCIDDIDDLQRRKFRQDPVLSSLADVASPIFLGIDRRFKTPRKSMRRRRIHSSPQIAFEFERERNLEDPSFDPGLGEVAFVIEDFTRLLRMRQAGIDDRFRKQILLDSFTFVDPKLKPFRAKPLDETFNAIKGKRETIMQTLQSLELASDELGKKSDEFFTAIERVIDTIKRLMVSNTNDQLQENSKELEEALTTWFINQPQVDRIDGLFVLANEYREKRAAVYRPLHDFVKLSNGFFKQIGKEVTIDRVGGVKILTNKKKTSLNALSSGERQIFIMLAHLSLNSSLLKDGVFIVDEPELSLHMAWQNMFVEAIEAANPNLQIILATHAPAIIGGRDTLCIPVSSMES